MASTSSSQIYARATVLLLTGVSVGTGVGTAVCSSIQQHGREHQRASGGREEIPFTHRQAHST
eukprot:1498-Heterococcus_DN1.PRE.1